MTLIPRHVFSLAVSLFAGLFLLTAPYASAQQPVPELRARVTDLTGTLSTAERDQLEQKLAALEQQKGSQLYVLIVPTTKPDEIEQYSIRIVDKWKVGRNKVDDGVLLLVAKNDRRLRIEVGRGLEGVLTDITTHRIIDEIITPEFKTGNFAGGINSGVDTMIKLINGEQLPPPPAYSTSGGPEAFPWPVFLFIGLGFTGMLRQLFGKGWGGAIAGIFAFAIVSYLATVLIGVAVGLVFFLLTYIGAISTGGSSSGGWSSGGSFGGGGGGGFSGGGGGSFGGGGSSGSW